MKTCMKQLLLLAFVFVTITVTGSNLPKQQSSSKVTKEYRTAVKALLDVMGYEKNLKDHITSTVEQFGFEDDPEVKGFVNEMVSKMPDKMVDIYSKYFTLDEIKQLTEFNKNEIQIKITDLQPQISKDMMQESKCLFKGEKSPTADIVVEKDFDEAMREYLEVSGFKEQMAQMNSLIENFYKIQSGTLDKPADQMPDIIVRVYSKYFTTSEIKQATALAKTPCFKKWNEKTIAIAQDTLEVTRELTMELIEKFIAENSSNDTETPDRSKGWFLKSIKSLNHEATAP